MAATASSYRNLFHGAARLGVLLGTLDLPWPRVTPYVSAFSGELNGYQELSLDGAGTTLGLMTKGSGKDFAFRVTRYMEGHGICENSLRRFLVRSRFFQHRNLLFKVEVGPKGPTEFSYYFRQRASLEVARAWLTDSGVDAEGLGLMEACAQEMEKRSVHFLAAGERPVGESLEKVYFSQPNDGKGWRKARDAGRIVGLTESCWAPLSRHRDNLTNRSLFFSISFAQGKPSQGAKLDIQGVDADTVEALMKQGKRPQEACDRTRLLLALFDKDAYDYLGVRLYPDGSITTKVYVYKSRE